MRLFGNGTFTHTRFVGPANPLTKSWPNASRTWLRRLEFRTLFFVEMYLAYRTGWNLRSGSLSVQNSRNGPSRPPKLVGQAPGRTTRRPRQIQTPRFTTSASIPQGAGLPKSPDDTFFSRETEFSGFPAYTPDVESHAIMELADR